VTTYYTQRLSCKYYLISQHLTLVLQHQQNSISGVCETKPNPPHRDTVEQPPPNPKPHQGSKWGKEVSVWTYSSILLVSPSFPSPNQLGVWVTYGWSYSPPVPPPPFSFSPPSVLPTSPPQPAGESGERCKQTYV